MASIPLILDISSVVSGPAGRLSIHCQRRPNKETALIGKKVVQAGSLLIIPDINGCFWVDGRNGNRRSLKTSPTETKLLACLVEKSPDVVQFQDICDETGIPINFVGNKYAGVRVAIFQLRRRIESAKLEEQILLGNEHGIGYSATVI